MWAGRGTLGAASPHFPTGFRVGTSHVTGPAWTQLWARRGRIDVTDRAAPSGSCAVLSWVNRAPTRETRPPALASHAQTPPPLVMIGNVMPGAAALSLTWDTRATMDACIHIDTRTAPGLARAHGPPNCTRPHRNMNCAPVGASLYARRFHGAPVKPLRFLQGR